MSEWASTTWPGLVPNRGSTCFGVLLPSLCFWGPFCLQNGVRCCIRLFQFLYDQGTAFESICCSNPKHVVITGCFIERKKRRRPFYRQRCGGHGATKAATAPARFGPVTDVLMRLFFRLYTFDALLPVRTAAAVRAVV